MDNIPKGKKKKRMKLTKKGKAITSIILLFTAALLLIIIRTTGDLSCQIEESSCTNQGTILLYMQNDTGGWDNAHAENVSSATYNNVLCCNSTNNTLTTFCGGTGPTFLNLSTETNAHVEYAGYDNYNVASCINIEADPTNMSCSIEPTGCPSDSICLVSMASDGADNKTNAHISSCGVYDTQVCCHVNTRPTVVELNEPLNETSLSSISEFNWSNATDADNDDIYYIFEIFNDTGTSYYNASIKETGNTTEYVYAAGDFAEGNWFWRVLATDQQDNATAWSETRYFTYDIPYAPVIENITFQGDPSVILSEAIPTPIIISFLAVDFDGASNIDNSTAYLNVSKEGSGMHENATANPYDCYPETVGSNATAQNYTCTVDMQYWDLAGSWACTAEIGDDTVNASLVVDNCFTAGTTTAINITSDTLAWSSLKVGQMDSLMSTSELNVTNTGNTNLTNVTLQAISPIGEATNAIWIPADNFTATWGERICSTGTWLINDTNVQLPGSTLDSGPGSLVTTNNATHVCLEEVGQDITQQSYSTGDIEYWTIIGGTGSI